MSLLHKMVRNTDPWKIIFQHQMGAAKFEAEFRDILSAEKGTSLVL